MKMTSPAGQNVIYHYLPNYFLEHYKVSINGLNLKFALYGSKLFWCQDHNCLFNLI